MAVENQPAPVQPENPRLTISRDFIQVIGAAAALAAVIIAGMALVVSITVAPLREDVRSLQTEMRRGFEIMGGEIASLRQDMNDEFKAVRSDMTDLRERLTRVETLIERDMGQPGAPDAQP